MNAGETETGNGLPLPRTAEMTVNLGDLRSRAERLNQSAVFAAACATPVFFAVFTVIVLVFNRTPETGVLAHIVESVISGALAAVTCGGFAWLGLFQMVLFYRKNMETLARAGRVVEVKRCRPPVIYGGWFVEQIIGGALGTLWEPTATFLSPRLPAFQVSYTFEIDGRTVGASELFYGDETITYDEGGTARVLVDPKRPSTRRWLLREPGALQDGPLGPSAVRTAR